jgi:hypothetical protein
VARRGNKAEAVLIQLVSTKETDDSQQKTRWERVEFMGMKITRLKQAVKFRMARADLGDSALSLNWPSKPCPVGKIERMCKFALTSL